MIIICFCGTEFEIEGDLGQCPTCKEAVSFPKVTSVEAEEMQKELDRILQGDLQTD